MTTIAITRNRIVHSLDHHHAAIESALEETARLLQQKNNIIAELFIASTFASIASTGYGNLIGTALYVFTRTANATLDAFRHLGSYLDINTLTFGAIHRTHCQELERQILGKNLPADKILQHIKNTNKNIHIEIQTYTSTAATITGIMAFASGSLLHSLTSVQKWMPTLFKVLPLAGSMIKSALFQIAPSTSLVIAQSERFAAINKKRAR